MNQFQGNFDQGGFDQGGFDQGGFGQGGFDQSGFGQDTQQSPGQQRSHVVPDEFQNQGYQPETIQGGEQDYYGGDSTQQAQDMMFQSTSVMDNIPRPGYFALDGTYVPATNMTAQTSSTVDEANGPLRQWEISNLKVLEERDAEELRVKSEQQAQARKEIDDAKASRAKFIAANTEKNINAEQVFISERDAVVNDKNLWDRVTRMIDVSKQHSESADVSRFRALLLNLKHSPI
jgi:hypothetical protein